MNKYEIIYDWAIEEIDHLTNSDDAENYSNNLIEPQLSDFVALTEKIRVFGLELEKAKQERKHFNRWNELRGYSEELSSKFTPFRTPSVEKLNLSLLLAGKLSDSLESLDETDINTTIFELRELTQPLPHVWFCRENSRSLDDSVILFSCEKLNEVSSEIISATISPILLFHFMAALHSIDNLPHAHAILVKKMPHQVDESAINAFARLVVLTTGMSIHATRKYTKRPNVLNTDAIQLDEEYQQWNEVLNVLSEYNSRDETLLKFLTIYHVIENVMFKCPIVELERQNNGQMFSIRDFRRLYAKVDVREDEALKNLFKKIFSMQSTPGVTFKDILTNRWDSLFQSTQGTDIDAVLKMIGLDFTTNAFTNTTAVSCFTKLVYTIRNTIVHNKETEFHLTFAQLDMNPRLCKLIEDFLLPSLEEMCFALIGKKNHDFWYQHKKINLYI